MTSSTFTPRPPLERIVDALETLRPTRCRPSPLTLGQGEEPPVVPIAARYGAGGEVLCECVTVIKSWPARIRGRVVATLYDDDLPMLHVGIMHSGQVGGWPLLWRLGCHRIECHEVAPGVHAHLLISPGWHLKGDPFSVSATDAILRATRRAETLHVHLHMSPDDERINLLRRGARVQIDLCLSDMYRVYPDGEAEQATVDVGDCWHAWPIHIEQV